MPLCNQCGISISATAKFCSDCGGSVFASEETAVAQNFSSNSEFSWANNKLNRVTTPSGLNLSTRWCEKCEQSFLAPEGVGLNCQSCGMWVDAVIKTAKAHVMGGAGWAPPIGDNVSIEISDLELILRVTSLRVFRVPFSDLTDISINGFSSTTSAGLIGGGFGFKGAAEGILAATIINRLTTETKEWVIVNVIGKTGSVELLITNTQEMPVRKLFRKAQDGLVQSASPHLTESKDSIASSLERVIALFEKGLLTEVEFQAAKAKILE
jgi:hypothetical protein